MQVLRLIQKNGFDLKYRIGEEIGYGADGQVFNLLDFEDWVIKLSVLYDNRVCENPAYENIRDVLSFIEKGNESVCVRVHEHKYIGSGTEKTPLGERNYILYYYVMDRLNKISEDEKRVFHSILSHEDRNIKKYYSLASVTDMLRGMQRGLDFDYNKVFNFYRNVRVSKLNHQDLHVRNIMKDNDGNFKLIDFDRATIGK
jgi:RIO-like serine/threonine protein kinase